MQCYILIGQTPVPVDDWVEWARWFESADRRVALTRIGPFEVSTVFLGLDHSFGDGEPLIFETMTFLCGGEDCEGCNECDGRWSTWTEAEQAHRQAVRFLQATYCHAGEQPEELWYALEKLGVRQQWRE